MQKCVNWFDNFIIDNDISTPPPNKSIFNIKIEDNAWQYGTDKKSLLKGKKILIEHDNANNQYKFLFPGFGGRYFPNQNLCVADYLKIVGEPYFALTLLLRFLLSLILIKQNGFAFHSSCINKNNGAYLFIGRSEAGKSTILHLSEHREAQVIAEESNYIKLNKNKYLAFYHPLDTYHKSENNYPPVELKGIFLINQSPDNRVQILDFKTSITSLLDYMNFSLPDIESKTLAMDNIVDLVNKVPCYKLFFKKDPSFWDDIDKLGL